MAGEPSRRRPDHRRVRVGQELGRRGDRYLLKRHGDRFALLDLDYLSWADPDTGDRAADVQAIRAALDLPLKVVQLAAPLAVIEQRLASDVTSGRREDLREAAEQIATAEGVGLEDVTIVNDRPSTSWPRRS